MTGYTEVTPVQGIIAIVLQVMRGVEPQNSKAVVLLPKSFDGLMGILVAEG
jgi:hypothetical protein